jgi:L-cysteate sulfo-lyase
MDAADPLGLARFPRVELCHRPTPIEPLDRLSDHLGGPRLFVKRDDCTGLATGGNKTRKLEFLLGEALAEGADTVVTVGAPQSNHVRQTAAAAARVGVHCHAVLERWSPAETTDYFRTGNVLLDQLLGATIEWCGAGADLAAASAVACERLAADGRRPYLVPVGGSTATGALGYVEAAGEIVSQRPDEPFDWIITATGSTGTHAGLLVGSAALGCDTKVLGFSVKRRAEPLARMVHELCELTAAKLGVSPVPVDAVPFDAVPFDAVVVDDGSVAGGYGVPDASTIEAVELTARLEGLLLDPVYTGKAMAGLIRRVRSGFFDPSDRVLFLHTGGSQALYAYQELLGQRSDGAG